MIRTTADLAARLSAMREGYYQALKRYDFDLYRRAIQAAEAVTLNHHLTQRVAVEIESAVVMTVCDALKLKPEGVAR